ncbi:MAG: hypothetical protein ACYS99_04605 [Planctomycetota bacterium]|jgi:hypothetical protein
MADSNAPVSDPQKEEDRKEERRAVSDRRGGGERRAGYDRRAGKERRRSEGRRASDHDISEHRKVERRINEYPMTDEELEFIKAVNDYKQRYNKPFPTWSEILHILKSIGYSKP